MLQAMMEACEDRHAARQAERDAAKAAQAPPAPPQPSTPADLQQLVQQAVQQALAAPASGHTAVAADGPPPASPPLAAPQAPSEDEEERWCDLYQVGMKQRHNSTGSWHSHWLADEQRWCKGE